ncbi:MAG: TetR/AcrR family transcriptional regulator [Aestuariibacter sp.]
MAMGNVLGAMDVVSDTQSNSKNKRSKSAIRNENQTRILEAAAQLFALKGFNGATVQEIAEVADLPKANVLYYYKSKRILYTELLTRILRLWNSSFDNATEDDDPAESLTKYISEKMELSRTHPNASKIFAMEMINGAPHLSESMQAQMREWFSDRKALINAWIKQDKMQPVDPEFLLFQIWSSTQHYADFAAQISLLRDNQPLTKNEFQHASDYLCRSILSGCGLTISSD